MKAVSLRGRALYSDDEVIFLKDCFVVKSTPRNDTKINKRPRRAQSTIEFTFAMVMIALLIYGLLRIFRWTGMDYAERSNSYSTQQFTDPRMRALYFVNDEESQLNSSIGDRSKRMGAFTRNF